jgi:high-affinity nickel-transport protein
MTALGVPGITLRHDTERPIPVGEGTTSLVGTEPGRIIATAENVLSTGGKQCRGMTFPRQAGVRRYLTGAFSGRFVAMPDMPADILSLLVFGFLLGVRHATDADHVIAIATIVSRQGTLRGSALIGAAWGVGHTITVLAVGSAIILFGVLIPPRLGLAMEFSVGVMLVLLGAMTLMGLGQAIGLVSSAGATDRGGDIAGWPLHDHVHAHGDYVHRHLHAHGPEAHGHGHERTPVAMLDTWFSRRPVYRYIRPLAIGVVHGLAGSAAIALLVLSAVRNPAWGLAYLVIFGIGTVAGMMIITVALSLPFTFTSGALPRLNRHLRTAAGLLSFCAGLFLVYQIGFTDGGLFADEPVWTPS